MYTRSKEQPAQRPWGGEHILFRLAVCGSGGTKDFLSLCLVSLPLGLVIKQSLSSLLPVAGGLEWLSGRLMVPEDCIQFISIEFSSRPLLLPSLQGAARLGSVV